MPYLGSMASATLQDRFEAIFGTRRGASRVLNCDAVSVAYEALSAVDLDSCLTLKLDADEKALIAAAKVDRDVLELLRPHVFHVLATQADMRSVAPRPIWAELSTRLRACGKAREARDDEALAALGGRRLGMFSVEGNVSLSKLLDEVIAFPLTAKNEAVLLLNVYRSKIKQIGEAHGEVHDQVVQDNIRADLEHHGVNKLLLNTLVPK